MSDSSNNRLRAENLILQEVVERLTKQVNSQCSYIEKRIEEIKKTPDLSEAAKRDLCNIQNSNEQLKIYSQMIVVGR